MSNNYRNWLLMLGTLNMKLFVERYPPSKNKSCRFLDKLQGKYIGYPAFFNGLR